MSQTTPPPSDRTQASANNAAGKVVPPDVRLHELIGEYWTLAYNEGKEGRTHDTAFGDAQRVARAICDTIRELAAAPTSEPSISQAAPAPQPSDPLTDEQTAVKFYQDNPSAALFDMRQRLAPPPQVAGVPSELEREATEWAREDVTHKPCPFCGSEEVSRSVGQKGDGTPFRYIECESCAAMAEPEFWDQRIPGVDAAKPLRWLTNREILPILQQAMTFEQCCDLTQKAIAQLNGPPLHGAAGDGKDGM